jgi:hypothetical protein
MTLADVRSALAALDAELPLPVDRCTEHEAQLRRSCTWAGLIPVAS